ncbi:WXG100 family type VII secretion target [Gordonia sp. NPDC003424]
MGCNYEDPFKDLKPASHDGPSLNPTADPANDLPGKVHAEDWSLYDNFYDITIPLHQMNEGVAGAAATNWATLYQYLSGAKGTHESFVNTFSNSQDWQGDGKDAANGAMRDYATALQDLVDRVSSMAHAVQHAADGVNAVKNSIPSEQEVNSKLAAAGADESQVESARQELLKHAREQMSNFYNPRIAETAAAAPVFAAPTTSAGADPAPASVPTGLGSGGGGGSLGGSGAVPSASAPDMSGLIKDAGKTPNTTTPSSTKLASSSSIPNALTSGLSQASNLGQSAIGQAQNAASKLGSLAKSPLTAPAGLHALSAAQKKAAAGLAALGKVGGAGGAAKASGGGGGASLGKLGGMSKALTDAEKLALSRGVRGAMDAEKAAAATARGASSTGGAAPIGGAGGARGAGGEDKEHKANKYLRTTLNGEVLIGAPPVVTSAVIKEG